MNPGPIESDKMFVSSYSHYRKFAIARKQMDKSECPWNMDKELWDAHKDALDSVIKDFEECLDEYALKKIN